MSQKYWLLLIIVGSLGSFIYFRHIDKEYHKMDKLLFALGAIFILTGGLIVFILNDFQYLLNCLLLHDASVSGKLILIGYIFLLISILIKIEKKILNIFPGK